MNDKLIVRLEVSNSVNDDISVRWYFAKSNIDLKNWVTEREKEKKKWHKTVGAVSIRYYDYSYYNKEELLNTNVEDLKGLKLVDILNLINNS
jgi:predicted adenine nucleotide alpha hydrolase (AANH) superfamily ATPase